jgi:hypothetical protein
MTIQITLNNFLNSLFNHYNWNNQCFNGVIGEYDNRYQKNRLCSQPSFQREIIISKNDLEYYRKKVQLLEDKCDKMNCLRYCEHFDETMISWLATYPCENTLPAEFIAHNGKVPRPLPNLCTVPGLWQYTRVIKDCLLCRKFYCLNCRSTINPKLCNRCYLIHPQFGLGQIKPEETKEQKTVQVDVPEKDPITENSYTIIKGNRKKTVIVLGTTLGQRNNKF